MLPVDSTSPLPPFQVGWATPLPSTLKSQPFFPHPEGWTWERDFRQPNQKHRQTLDAHRCMSFQNYPQVLSDERQWCFLVLRRLTTVYNIWISVVISYVIHWKHISEKTLEWSRRQSDSLKSYLCPCMCFTAAFYLLPVPFSCNLEFMLFKYKGNGPDLFRLSGYPLLLIDFRPF